MAVFRIDIPFSIVTKKRSSSNKISLVIEFNFDDEIFLRSSINSKTRGTNLLKNGFLHPSL